MKLEGKYKRIQVVEVANPDGKIISRSVIAYDNEHELEPLDVVYRGWVEQLVSSAPTIEISVEETNPAGGRVGDVNITPDGTVYQLELVGEEDEWVLKGQIKTSSDIYTHTQQFTYAGATIEIEGENYPYVELNHMPLSILSAHIDHVYVYSDEYILSDQVLAFRFDNLVTGDVIEVVYTSNEDGSI